MGTLNMSRDNLLPVWVVRAGIALILLMGVALIVCVLRDIAEMRVLWAVAEAAGRRTRKQRPADPSKETPSRQHHRHGVCLLETDLRNQTYMQKMPERKVE